ncbi:MAG: RIP metalloprotease RseP [Gemmatimonadetes bacterium]|nr:RIP metalloprotease RseP [Gemmatimonadota bacterium]
MLLTIAAAVVVLGAVIFVHEVGHFLAAKATGVGVIRFSIGFGPATPLRFRRGDTEYVLSWFPLGGYVMMASEEETSDETGGVRALEGGPAQRAFPPEQQFESKPLWARILVITAGVLMNAAFAWGLYAALALGYGSREDPTTVMASVDSALLPAGATALAEVAYPQRVVRINGDTIGSWNDLQSAVLDPTTSGLSLEFAGSPSPVLVSVPGTPGGDRVRLFRALKPAWAPRLGYLAPGRPAAAAGLTTGDLVLAANGDSVRYWDDLVRVVEAHAGDTVTLVVQRADSLFTVRLVPTAESDTDLVAGGRRVVGKVGVGPHIVPRHVRYSLSGAVREATRRAWADAGLVLFAVKGLVTGNVSPRELGGPIFIGQLSGQLAQVGLEPFLAFIALFSINLAVLNLLPIPVLDGGRLLFLLAEGVRGRPLSRALRIRLSQVGVALLLAIMLLALTNDVLRLFGG